MTQSDLVILILLALNMSLVAILLRHYFVQVDFMRLFFRNKPPEKKATVTAHIDEVIKLTDVEYASVLGREYLDFYTLRSTFIDEITEQTTENNRSKHNIIALHRILKNEKNYNNCENVEEKRATNGLNCGLGNNNNCVENDMNNIQNSCESKGNNCENIKEKRANNGLSYSLVNNNNCVDNDVNIDKNYCESKGNNCENIEEKRAYNGLSYSLVNNNNYIDNDVDNDKNSCVSKENNCENIEGKRANNSLSYSLVNNNNCVDNNVNIDKNSCVDKGNNCENVEEKRANNGLNCSLVNKNNSVDNDVDNDKNSCGNKENNCGYNSKDDELILKKATKKPLLIWVHGGGYISGDKATIGEWARELAARCDINVACINYRTAPEQHYPGAVVQTGEALDFLLNRKNKFGIDSSKIFMAGDSAGAQIVAQYSNLVCNKEFRHTMGIYPKIKSGDLRGLGLFCGFYDTETAIKTHFPAIKTFLWAYTNCKKMKNFPRRDEMNIVKNLNSEFPPAFITCGNRDKFYSESVAFVSALHKNGTPVDPLLEFDAAARLPHEYQFAPLDNPYSALAISRFAEFIFAHTHENL